MVFYRMHLDASGSALLLVLLALSILSLLSLFMSLNATTGVHISDNYESQIQATYAALAGLNHARALIRGSAFNDLLRGPDGAWDASGAYMAEARTFRFRYPIPIQNAQMLDIIDPTMDVSGINDDGIISTGTFGGINGTALIPTTGISLTAPNPYGAGTIVTSRYFVKTSDNNGEASEISGDAANNPFTDGDGIVIVRSLGVSRTLSDKTGLAFRRNSIALFEARFKRLATWDTGPALVVLGPNVNADINGAYEISGGASPGIGAIDTISSDGIFPDQIIRAAARGSGEITGGSEPIPSIRDITGSISTDRDQRLLLDPAYLWDFINNQAPAMADSFHSGNQSWLGGIAPYCGSYDSAQPRNAPGQDPKITVVNGDLHVSGGFAGGGLLIVTGNLSYSDAFDFSGLVLVLGSGNLIAAGSGSGIEGALLVGNLANTGGNAAFGSASIAINGNSRIHANRENVRMAISLIPASQISFREIAGTDP